MGLDQHYKQNNEITTDVGGTKRLLNREEESSLILCELCGIVIIISSFEERINPTPFTGALKYKKHHEDTPASKQRFFSDIKGLLEIFIVDSFYTDDFPTVNNKTIIFDEEKNFWFLRKTVKRFLEKNYC